LQIFAESRNENMKIVLTGSIGHIGKPLAVELVEKGHRVTVITSNPEKQKDIESLGAVAAIGSIEDLRFLTAAFTGADMVYCMVPPVNYMNTGTDLMAHCRLIGENYAQAIAQTGVKRVIHLSSVGAHLDKNSGLILCHRAVEGILNTLADVAITFVRPVGIYYNLYSFLPMIKNAGVISANYGGDDMLIWVSPVDIASAVAEEIETPMAGRKVRYAASDLLTGNETASILGEAIGKPDLKWILIPGEQMQRGLETAGLPSRIAAGLVEMFASQHEGSLTEDYYRHQPAVMGKVKLKDFAMEFAVAFNKNN
jgi:uncharacterized protein YbjT (DUF2867 family)